MEEENSQHKNESGVTHKLKRRNHFSYIYRNGQRFSSKYLTLFVVPSKFKSYKIGYSVSKKLGKANVRNKTKRRLKEIVRRQIMPKGNFNYVLLAREGAEKLSFEELTQQTKKVFLRAQG